MGMSERNRRFIRRNMPSTARARERRSTPMQRRELVAQSLVASLFLLAAGALAAFGLDGEVKTLDLLLLVLATALLGRLEFEAGNGYTVPTQLTFVPMLFILPPAIVPLAVATALALDRLPDVVARRWHPQRLLGVFGDAWFAVGPALVFVLAGLSAPELADWPLYMLALSAQLFGDLMSATVREAIGHGHAPRQQLAVMREVWIVDVLLSPAGLLAAYATVSQDHAYLFVVPPAALLCVLARERRQRIGHAIELAAAYRGTALLLGDVLSDDDEYTGMHTANVVEFALQIADEQGVDDEQRRLVELGAMLHDVGKIATPKEIINKPGPLTDEEWLIMRRHTVAGQQMLDRVGGVLADVGRVVRSSHEHYDGSGYPDGLSGEDIPRAARIVAVAHAFSAMTTSRSYRAALPEETARAELRRNAGTQFDPAIVAAVLRLLDRTSASRELLDRT
jgi:putative nucleotidyltransferase with HDIG domain